MRKRQRAKGKGKREEAKGKGIKLVKKSIFLGLDLAGSPKRPTGWAAIDENKRMFIDPGEVFSDEQIKSKIEDLSPQWIGIDAPLSLPQGKEECYSSRFCDRQLRELGIPCLPPALLGSLTFRGVRLAQELKKKNYSFIEVYPRATQEILGIKPKGKKPTLKWREGIQKRLSFWILGIPPQELLFSAHTLDALLCAYTAYCRGKGKFQEIGDEEGIIVIPL